MSKIVECVPNFSEGRRTEVIDSIIKEILSVEGIILLDKEMNADHNRAVISFVGEPTQVVEAAFRGCKKAAELIDLNHHQGEHPRIGATDVIPFIPIANITMEECVCLAKELGKRIAEELNIPVYLYESAATRPDRVDLANIRKGEFEGLKTAIKTDPSRAPDFGKPELHPTAGAVVVGARFPLIAYNINLNTTDVSIAKKIAKAIRFRDGGYRYVKALGFSITEKNCVQVSINMTNYLGTPLYRVFETVKREAERYGVTIRESEIVGLVPQKALIDSAVYYLQLNEFNSEQILESKLTSAKGKTIEEFLFELSQPTPTPGGGSCSALAGAVGASLLLMVINLTLAKPSSEEIVKELNEIKDKIQLAQKQFYELIHLDAESFNQVIQAYKLPKATDEEKKVRKEKILQALKDACRIPEQVFDLALSTINLAKPIAEKGNKNAISDVGVAISYLKTAMEGARLNILINLKSIKDIIRVEPEYKNYEVYINETKLRINPSTLEIESIFNKINQTLSENL
ncbi:MAG: glutamate formimidoyltransferase [candidate division WOR-3 bacterium]|nr:glutamate formimidoyltransferase [candidate division WOR-3 bacterium]